MLPRGRQLPGGPWATASSRGHRCPSLRCGQQHPDKHLAQGAAGAMVVQPGIHHFLSGSMMVTELLSMEMETGPLCEGPSQQPLPAWEGLPTGCASTWDSLQATH